MTQACCPSQLPAHERITIAKYFPLPHFSYPCGRFHTISCHLGREQGFFFSGSGPIVRGRDGRQQRLPTTAKPNCACHSKNNHIQWFRRYTDKITRCQVTSPLPTFIKTATLCQHRMNRTMCWLNALTLNIIGILHFQLLLWSICRQGKSNCYRQKQQSFFLLLFIVNQVSERICILDLHIMSCCAQGCMWVDEGDCISGHGDFVSIGETKKLKN